MSDEKKKAKIELYTPKHPLKIRVAAFIGSYLIWAAMHLLFLTCRLSVYGDEIMEKVKANHGGKMIGASWHRSLFFTVFFFRYIGAALMSSRSKDGELVSALLRRFGYTPPRGSSGPDKGGRQALDEFIELVNLGNPGGIATDAPKGPPYVSKFGVVVAAQKTGVPIIPFNWNANNVHRINSWDRSMIPKPFSRIVLVFDREPLEVPPDSTGEELELIRKKLDERINYVTYQADHYFELEKQYPDPRDIPVPDPIPEPFHPPRKPKKKK